MPAMTGVGYFAHCRAGDLSPFEKHQQCQEVNHLEKPVLVQQTALEQHELWVRNNSWTMILLVVVAFLLMAIAGNSKSYFYPYTERGIMILKQGVINYKRCFAQPENPLLDQHLSHLLDQF